MSDELLKKIGESGEKIDLLFIDGRLGPRDCEILGGIVAEDCVFILDDFEYGKRCSELHDVKKAIPCSYFDGAAILNTKFIFS